MADAGRVPPRHRLAAVIGAFYLVMAGINIGLTVADASMYQHFADAGLFPFVRTGWREIVMDRPEFWFGLLAAGEIAIGAAFLGGAAWRRAAYVAAIGFHVALMLFGWMIWMWAVPALVLLVTTARHDLRRTALDLIGRRPPQGRSSGRPALPE